MNILYCNWNIELIPYAFRYSTLQSSYQYWILDCIAHYRDGFEFNYRQLFKIQSKNFKLQYDKKYYSTEQIQNNLKYLSRFKVYPLKFLFLQRDLIREK